MPRCRLGFLNDIDGEVFKAVLDERGTEGFVSCAPTPAGFDVPVGEVLRRDRNAAVHLGAAEGLSYFLHVDVRYLNLIPDLRERAGSAPNVAALGLQAERLRGMRVLVTTGFGSTAR